VGYWKNTKGKSHAITMAGIILLAVISTLSLKMISSQLLFVFLVMWRTIGMMSFLHKAPAAQANNMAISTNDMWRTMGTALPEMPVRRIKPST
jgi:hypothetical protein